MVRESEGYGLKSMRENWPDEMESRRACPELVERGRLSMETPPFPLSSRPKRSVAEGSAVPRTFRGSVFRRCVANRMLFTPHKGVILSVIWAGGPPKVMKNAFCSATDFHGNAALPLSSRPKRSVAEGSAVPRTFVEVFFDGAKRRVDLSHSGRLMARSRRTPRMLVRRHSSELSGHRLQGKLKKSQALRMTILWEF